ncbi:MAG: hypothetical protein WC408_01795 [Candidatus Micrarchaeia archaeon]
MERSSLRRAQAPNLNKAAVIVCSDYSGFFGNTPFDTKPVPIISFFRLEFQVSSAISNFFAAAVNVSVIFCNASELLISDGSSGCLHLSSGGPPARWYAFKIFEPSAFFAISSGEPVNGFLRKLLKSGSPSIATFQTPQKLPQPS